MSAPAVSGTSRPISRLWKDRYLIVGELGRGGFGVVYLAQDEQLLSKRVVIKVLLNEADHDPYLQKKFQQEIEALARIDHPGVVGVLDVGETPEGKPFLVMQYVEGVTLRQEISKGSMDFRRAGELIRQIGQALGAAHEKGIFHRDLKPENVMIARRNETEEYARLIDFGIAAVRDSRVAAHGDASKIVGTVSYMAPEQVLGRTSAASDTFSLGVVIFEMLTGRRPEISVNGLAVKPRELRSAIPEAAEAILLRALSYQPDKRPAAARQFADQISRALLQESLSTARSASATSRLSGATAPVLAADSGELEMANVLFTDIVEYSKLPMELQSQLVQQFQEIVRSTPEFQRAQQVNQIVSIPTGDGIALVFFQNPVAPVKCAVEIAHLLADYPHIKLRMGIHTGLVHRISDINANRNVAGGGINLAQRVMDCGDAGHILLSKTIADIVGQLTDWAPLLRDLGDAEVKHGTRISLVNLCADGIGNPAIPEKMRKSQRGVLTVPVSRQKATTFLKTVVFPALQGGSAVLSLVGVLFLVSLGLLSVKYVATPSGLWTAEPKPVDAALPATISTSTGEMVLIGEGPFLSGTEKKSVNLSPYYMDRTEVTNDAYARFCAATKRELPPGLRDAHPDFPVVNITIDEAREFARWAGKRLPLRTEWEKAARGSEGWEFPWGNDPAFNKANVILRSDEPPARSLASVRDFSAADSPYGVRQMIGNVWEFVDELSTPTPGTVEAFLVHSGLTPPPTSSEAWFLIAGGSYRDPARPAYETVLVPARFSSERIGFRLVKDAR